MRRPIALTTGLMAATCLVAGIVTKLAISAGRQSAGFYILEIGAALVWAGVGALAVLIRPDRPTAGRLMQLFGLVLVLDAPAGFDLVTSDGWVAIDLVVAHVVQPFQIAVFGHALLSYPAGRLRHGLQRWVIAAAYCWAAVVSVVAAIDTIAVVTGPGWAGARPPGAVTGGRPSSLLMNGVWLALAAVYLMLLIGKVRRATRRERRVLAYPYGSGLLILLLFAITTGLATVGVNLGVSLAYLAVLVGPGSFLAGLVRERLSYGSVAELVRTIERAPVGQLQAALRKALRDPGLQVGFARGDGYVDELGEAMPLPPENGRLILPVGGEPPIAVVLHDASLVNEPKLLAAASAAARLALDNARLHALVQEQLAEVRASRRRIIEAGTEQRRGLERDLHDGAQQRMLSIGIVLQLLERQIGHDDASATELLAEARMELQAAVDELRELARGIHPAVLTEHGLGAAVRMLVQRIPLPVVIDEDIADRPEPAVESAAYFMLSEALTNVVKHSGATIARVRLCRNGNWLRVEIVDDGVGGADPDRGSGLRGLTDRAAAFDGTVSITDVKPTGTQILVELRCD
jgi:signal transduction histidine kinase